MKNRKSLLFLWTALAFFVITLVGTIIAMQIDYYQTQSYFANDPQMARDLTNFSVAVAIVFIFPIFAIELSCIRSVYKFLRYEPKGIVKVCYLISAIISFLAFTFQFLVFVGVVDFKTGIKETVLFLTEWPVFIISFILGSIPIKHKDFNEEIPKTLKTEI